MYDTKFIIDEGCDSVQCIDTCSPRSPLGLVVYVSINQVPVGYCLLYTRQGTIIHVWLLSTRSIMHKVRTLWRFDRYCCDQDVTDHNILKRQRLVTFASHEGMIETWLTVCDSQIIQFNSIQFKNFI